MLDQRFALVSFYLRDFLSRKLIDGRFFLNMGDFLKEVSGDELLEVLTQQDVYGADREIRVCALLCFALGLYDNWQEKTEAILNVAKEKGILKKVLITSVNMAILNGDATPLCIAIRMCYWQEKTKAILNVAKEEGVLKEIVTKDIGRGSLVKQIARYGHESMSEFLKGVIEQSCGLEEFWKVIDEDDRRRIKNLLDENFEHKKSIAFDKAMRVGSICGVITGLAVGGGCFAAGIIFPILAIIGIAVAAALVTGLVAGGITYVMSKPSNELNKVDTQQEASQESEITA